MDEAAIRRQLLARHGIRIDLEMGQYVFRRLRDWSPDGGQPSIPIIGVDAVTGVPLRQTIDLKTIQPPPSA